jgi:hypothetical protein
MSIDARHQQGAPKDFPGRPQPPQGPPKDIPQKPAQGPPKPR